MTSQYFGDAEFDALLDLIVPFDVSFPELQIHFDKLLFQLTLEDSHAEIKDFDVFRDLAKRSRAKRAPRKFDIDYLLALFVPLGALLHLASRQYPNQTIHCDRVVYELAEAMRPGYHKRSFEQFHIETLMHRRLSGSKLRGRG